MAHPEHHILTRQGDGRAEVDAALDRLKAQGISREASGFAKYLFVTRAEQTVVFAESRRSPIAAELRGLAGWREPGDQELQ